MTSTGSMGADAILPVVPDWFRVTDVGDGVTLIEEPHVHELLRANLWLVRGRDRDLLVDAGLGVSPLRPLVGSLTARIPLLVLTHAHLDHMGSAHEFPEVLAHADEAVQDPPPGSLSGPALAQEVGLTEVLPPLLISARPSPGYEPAGYRLRPARVTRYLSDGDVVDLGDRTFTVLHLPGHSPGSLSLYDRQAAVLYSGDVVYDDVLLDDLHGSDRGRYRASMRRLRELRVRQVNPGHGPRFDGQRLHEIIDAYLRS